MERSKTKIQVSRWETIGLAHALVGMLMDESRFGDCDSQVTNEEDNEVECSLP